MQYFCVHFTHKKNKKIYISYITYYIDTGIPFYTHIIHEHWSERVRDICRSCAGWAKEACCCCCCTGAPGDKFTIVRHDRARLIHGHIIIITSSCCQTRGIHLRMYILYNNYTITAMRALHYYCCIILSLKITQNAPEISGKIYRAIKSMEVYIQLYIYARRTLHIISIHVGISRYRERDAAGYFPFTIRLRVNLFREIQTTIARIIYYIIFIIMFRTNITIP